MFYSGPKRFVQSLFFLSRKQKLFIIVWADSVLLIASVGIAYVLRLGGWFLPNPNQLLLICLSPLLAIPIFIQQGLYRTVIRYSGDQALWVVLKGMSLTALAWASIAFMTQMTGAAGVPRTVPLIFWFVGIALIAGLRFLVRFVFSLSLHPAKSKKPVLIYGAGNSGRQLAASLRKGNELSPVGFLDDDPYLTGKEIDGLRIYSAESVGQVITRLGVQTVIVTLDSASRSRKRELVSFLEKFSLRVRILPSVSSIAQGRHLVNMVREVDIGDLLGRDPVSADPILLTKCITDKTVLVTGAGGSIGSELCRQILALNPTRLLLLESNESSLFQIHRSLTSTQGPEVIPWLGSVTNRRLVTTLLKRYQVDTIYHAAAHKHVPLIETNLFEGVRNNVLGTLTLAQAAYNSDVKTFVLISTDKAVRPTSIMGATKRFSELVVQNLAQMSQKKGRAQVFCAVRFGNVLGSSGSVVPIFKEQISNGGPITVTHPEVTRYFMSIHEAVELVIQAGSLAEGGDIFLLDMGEPVKIVDLARNMIRLAGFKEKTPENPDGDMEIAFIGLRPGEKLYEELLIGVEGAQGTTHPKIMKAQEPHLQEHELHQWINHLRAGILYQDEKRIKEILFGVASRNSELQEKANPESAFSNILTADSAKPTLPC